MPFPRALGLFRKLYVWYANCFSRALRIFLDVLGAEHEDVGSALNLLAVVVGEQGRYLEVNFFLCVCVFVSTLLVLVGGTCFVVYNFGDFFFVLLVL